MSEPLLVEVWSDIVCPWCAIGRARLGHVLEAQGIRAEVVHRAFELDPHRADSVPSRQFLEERYGSEADVDAMMDRVRGLAEEEGLDLRPAEAVAANSFDGHRLMLWAQAQGKGGAMMDALVRAHFRDAKDISDPSVLAEAAKAAGLDPAEAREVLASDAYTLDVRTDEEEARILGIRGVPFFLFNKRVGLSGAQPPEVFGQALQKAQSVA